MVHSPAEWLDPESFPFSEEEVFLATSLWWSEAEAREFASQLAEMSRGSVDIRVEEERRGHPSRASGTTELSRLRIADHMKHPWLWPALSVLSPSAAARVDEWMSEWWRFRFLMELSSARTKAAERAGLYLSREAELDKCRAMGANVEMIPPSMHLHDPNVARPEATEEMRQEASDAVDVQHRAFLAHVEESKARLDARR